MPRLFTGIEVPAEISEWLALARGGLPGARWIDKQNYHITLRFIGDIDMNIADDIVGALDRVNRRRFSLTIDGLGSFGTRKPHSLIARIQPSQALSELQAEHERLMQRIGLPAEQRKYTPHITLARLRGVSGPEIANFLSFRGGLAAGPFEVSRFVLFSSRNSVGGGPYVVEESYPLIATPRSGPEALDGRALVG